MDQIDDGVRGDGVAEVVAVLDLIAIDERRHVVAKVPLIVEYVAAGLWMFAEVGFEDFPHGGAFHTLFGALDVPLDVAGEADERHALLGRARTHHSRGRPGKTMMQATRTSVKLKITLWLSVG